MSELQLSLGPVAEAGAELEVVDAELVTSTSSAVSSAALSPSPPPSAPGLEARNLFGEAERIAARGGEREHAPAVPRDFPRFR